MRNCVLVTHGSEGVETKKNAKCLKNRWESMKIFEMINVATEVDIRGHTYCCENQNDLIEFILHSKESKKSAKSFKTSLISVKN